MISQTMQSAINDQIKHEFNSAYVYLAMSAYCEAINLPGFARWMRLQYEEENQHALKLFEHVLDRDGRVALQALDQPPSDFKSPLEMMQLALGHERKVTGLIHRLLETAVHENDPAAQVLLQWFVTEQVEEEKSVGLIVEQLKMAGDQGLALLLLDRELAGRSPEAGAAGGAG
jgi:ferritin